MFELGLIVLFYILFVLYWWNRQLAHTHRLNKIKVRVHVNGIRGKSTVTRLIAGVLREAGYRVVGKTTGSAAVIIDIDGRDAPILRHGAVNVMEQQDIIAGWDSIHPDAMVIECMALHPKYQEWSEKMVIRAHIGVITNVRQDHQDVMGESLEEIATSLAHMCPTNGYLITAETNPDLQKILHKEAKKRGSQLIFADASKVSNEVVAKFNYISFKENIAIGLVVADLLGINHKIAIRGMLKAKEDIGVIHLHHVYLHGKKVLWANLFAVNDRESMIIGMQKLQPYINDRTVKIGILNNRKDREKRAEQFSDVAARDLNFDWLITFGAYEELVTRKLISNGFSPKRIVNLGYNLNPSIDQIIDAIAKMIPVGYQAILVGFVNIHTPQAEILMDYFERNREETRPVNRSILNVSSTQRHNFEITHK